MSNISVISVVIERYPPDKYAILSSLDTVVPIPAMSTSLLICMQRSLES